MQTHFPILQGLQSIDLLSKFQILSVISSYSGKIPGNTFLPNWKCLPDLLVKMDDIKPLLQKIIPFRFVPPRCAWRGMPYPVLFWRNRLFISFAWFMMETVFEWDCSSKVWSKLCRRILTRLIQCEIPLSLFFFEFLVRETVRVILLCHLVHLYALLLGPTNFELRFTINWISEKSIVDTCKMSTLRVNFLAASLPRIPGYMVLFLFFSFAVSSTMATPFLDHAARVERASSLSLLKFSSGFAFNQELSAGAVDKSLIPIKKTVRTLYFWYCFAQLE